MTLNYQLLDSTNPSGLGASYRVTGDDATNFWAEIQASGTADGDPVFTAMTDAGRPYQVSLETLKTYQIAGCFDGATVVAGKVLLSAASEGALALTGDQTAAGNKTFSGNTALGGTLGVTGATTLSSTLAVTGNTTLTGTLGVTGVTTLSTVLVNVTNAITAHVGGGQGSAVALTTTINRVTIVGSAADSVKLPTATAGKFITVINAAAANAMDVFPASGEIINALAANTALSVAANKTVTFYCAVAGTWNSLVTA